MVDDEIDRVVEAARDLPPAAGGYPEQDYIMNLLETVLDYQMHTTAVVKALAHFRDTRWNEIRTLNDLETTLDRFADDREGSTALAQYLWANNHWRRAQELRGLVSFFRSIEVVDAGSLRRWAEKSEFRRDFQGRVKGLGQAVYQSLVMRQGVETVKPDVHIRRFAEAAAGRRLTADEVIQMVTAAARRLGIKPRELDWRIWEASRSGAPPSPPGPE
jgi:hypothetical protein